ncbi:MAG: lipid-A-disaccharide synthase [Candidatus Rhabdochlamydia sp.]
MTTDLFFIAGELSGDRLGASLISALKKQNSHLTFQGVGGPRMREEGLKAYHLTEELQVMGFIDVAWHIPSLIKIFNKIVHTIMTLNSPLVVTIDYPGFNLRLAKALRKKGFQGKLCHVVCPSVWAWGKKRIQTLANNYDLLLTLFPFEKPLFSATSLQVTYIGHPLIKENPYERDLNSHQIAFFPGSRQKEIERNLPFYVRLMKQLKKTRPHLQFVMSVSQEKYRPLIENLVKDPDVKLLDQQAMKTVKPLFAVAKCGTIVLELALRGVPTIVTYEMSKLDVFLATYLFKIHLPYYSLPNLIMEKCLFPELIGPDLNDAALLQASIELLDDPEHLQKIRHECQMLRNTLKPHQDPSDEAARALLACIF